MARGINKVILIGNLGKDPEVRFMPSGAAVANVTLATAESWKDKDSGEKQERTEWHNVVFYNRLAEIVGEYLKKGSSVYVEGSLRTRKWQDKATGADRYMTEIIASEMQMLGSKSGGGGSSAAFDDAAGGSATHAGGAGKSSPASGNKPSSPPSHNDFDDDIPF